MNDSPPTNPRQRPGARTRPARSGATTVTQSLPLASSAAVRTSSTKVVFLNRAVHPWNARNLLWQTQELLAEVLNRSGFDTDADGEVLSIAEHFNLSGHLYAISFSQWFDQAIRVTYRHVNEVGVILQREGGPPTLPSYFILARTRQMDHTMKRHQFQIGGIRRRAEAPDRHLAHASVVTIKNTASNPTRTGTMELFLPRFKFSSVTSARMRPY